MKEILVTIYVLSLQQEFDVFIPIKLEMKEALDLIQNTIVDLSNENYEKKDNVVLFSDSGKIINSNNPVKYSGLTNGCKVVMV
ncbi:MAG: hypothetical protein IJ193_09295 [Bacilli bacterium]|nr:hypothetical protein [Bacilli bacterium]